MNIDYLRFTEDCRVLANKNRVILIHREKGKKIKISKECYDLLKEAESLKLTLAEIIERMEDTEDQKYIRQLIEILKKQELLSFRENNHKSSLQKVVFQITNRCNLHCKHCSAAASTAKEADPLGEEQIKEILEKIAAYGCTTLVFSGGEPMVREDFLSILGYCKSVYHGEMGLMTNGTLITEENVDLLTDALDFIDISVDGVDEASCAFIRGPKVFEQVINAVKVLQKNHFHQISLSMVEVEGNKHLVKEFYKLNRTLGTKPIVRSFADVGRGKENSALFMKEEKKEQCLNCIPEEILGQFRGEKSFQSLKTCTCGAARREIMIAPNGEIYPCVLLKEEKYKLSNALQVKDFQHLHAILEEQDQGGMKALQAVMPESHPICGTCNVSLFCWGCVEEIDRVSKDAERFQLRCQRNKPYLTYLVWGPD